MHNIKNKFINGVFWLGSAKFLGQTASWLITIFLVRLLTPQDFGIVAMVAAYEAIIIITYDLNLGAALVQKKDLDPLTIQTAFWFILGSSLILYISTMFLAPYIAVFFRTEKVTIVLRVYAIGIIFQSIQQVPYWLLAKQLEFDKQAKALFISNVISLIISLVLAFLGFGVWSLVLGFITKNFFQALFICLFFKWSDFFSWKNLFSFSWSKLYSLFEFSIPLTGFYSLRYIFMRSDTIIIGRFLGDEILGYYSVATDLARIPVDKFITIINQVCFPVFSELQDNFKILRHYFFMTIKFVSLIVFPVIVGASLLSNELVFLILTPKWQPIILLFICLCFVAGFQSLAGIMFMVINAIGKSRINFKFSLIAALLLPISFIIGVQYGALGVAVSWLIVYPLLFLYLLSRINSEIQAESTEFVNAIKLPFYTVVLMTLVVFTVKLLIGFDKISFKTLLLYVFVGAVTYITCIYLFSPNTIKELKAIYNELWSKKTKAAFTAE